METEFVEIIKEHEKIILKICNVYCKEKQDREDLYQEILIQLWKSFPSFSGKSKITTWIYRIAFNTAVTRYRKEKRTPERGALNDLQETVEPTENDNIERLYFAIGQLNPLEKAITMLYLEGTKYREIGEILGISESNVGFKINQIKTKLRKTLKIHLT